MNPIIYIEASCDQCSDEICSGPSGAEFGILRSGKLVCATCRDQRPDHEHFKNFSITKLEPPEESYPVGMKGSIVICKGLDGECNHKFFVPLDTTEYECPKCGHIHKQEPEP